MATKTTDVLQHQIGKLEVEANNIQEGISSHNMRFTSLNNRLDEVLLTIKQLKGFQSQLNGGVFTPQLSSRKTGLGLGNAESAGDVNTSKYKPYSPEQWTFLNQTIREKDSKGLSWTDIWRAFEKKFREGRSKTQICGLGQRIKAAGHLEGPMVDYREYLSIPVGLEQRPFTPPPNSAKDGHSDIMTPPATPNEMKDIHVEFLDNCGVIITIGNDIWYELRCHICGRNSSGNGQHFKGWEGLLRHLVKSHDDLDIVEGEDDIDFILRKCILREVSIAEVDDIEHGRRKIDRVKTDDAFGAKMVRDSGVVAVPQQQIQVENQEENVAMFDGFDLSGSGDGFGEAGSCVKGDGMETESSASTMPTPSELGRWKNKFAALELAPLLTMLDDYCPCTLSGHPCKAVICNKKELCLEHFHGLHCVNLNHELKPSCPDALNMGECTRSPLECKYEHQELLGHRSAIGIYHECECFEH